MTRRLQNQAEESRDGPKPLICERPGYQWTSMKPVTSGLGIADFLSMQELEVLRGI
jgi:hypothetical protein